MRPDLSTLKTLVLFCTVAMVVCGGGAAAGLENPHAFMDDPERCTECHRTAPEHGKDDYTTVTFTDTIVTLCSTCHEDSHYRDEHPVEIRPENEVPQEFHLDDYYTVTCATCHDPHGEYESERRYLPATFVEKVRSLLAREKHFRTYFLRRPNTKGELCIGCHREGFRAWEVLAHDMDILPQYVGSERCSECHEEIFDEWKRTLHARNYRDVSKEPDAVRAEFDGDKPFPPEDILFTVGEHWTQRYIVKGRKEPMVRPESWSLISRQWIKGGSFSRPWLRYCAGCHATALNPFDGSFMEAGTGCESCHGPGLNHVETTDQLEIVNPAALVESRRDMVCESCHTSGHDRSGVYRYPVGYRPGTDLTKYYRGLVPKAGQDAENFTGDGSYEDRHRQFLYWQSRFNILQGASCDVCSSHSRPPQGEQKEFRLNPNEMCGTCHRPMMEDFRGHSGHDEDQAGCLDCHYPRVALSGDSYSIHDHKFQFGKPAEAHVKGGDPCIHCHPGRGEL